MENFRSHLGCTRAQQQSILLWEISLNFVLPTGCWTSAAYNSPVVIHVQPISFFAQALLTLRFYIQQPFFKFKALSPVKRSHFLPA